MLTSNTAGGRAVNIPTEELIRLYTKEGLSIRQIAEVYFCTHFTVSNKLKALGVEIRSGYSKSYYGDRCKNKGILSKGTDGYMRKLGKRDHRRVMEEHLGRELSSEEQVHHIDFNRSNNELSNLFLFPSNQAHHLYHGYIKHCYITPSEFMATIYPGYLDTILNYTWMKVRYVDEVVSANQISKELGVNRTVVTNELKRTGVWALRPPSKSQYN